MSAVVTGSPIFSERPLLHPVGAATAAGVSSGEADVGLFPPGKAPALAMGILWPPPAVLPAETGSAPFQAYTRLTQGFQNLPPVPSPGPLISPHHFNAFPTPFYCPQKPPACGSIARGGEIWPLLDAEALCGRLLDGAANTLHSMFATPKPSVTSCLQDRAGSPT